MELTSTGSTIVNEKINTDKPAQWVGESTGWVPAERVETRREFDGDGQSPGLVRQFVRQVLDDWGIASVTSRDAMTLLASELASNAVEHAGNGFTVSIRRSADRAHVEVCDTDATLPTLREPSLASDRGRGLMIVDRVASAWGAGPAAGGKVVWFELSLDNAPAILP